MFEVIDVVWSAVGASILGLLIYRVHRKPHSRPPFDALVKRLIRYQQEFARREPWEHAAVATSHGLAWFTYSTFNAATNLSHISFCPRFVGTCVGLVVTYLLVRAVVRPVFRYFNEPPTQSSH